MRPRLLLPLALTAAVVVAGCGSSSSSSPSSSSKPSSSTPNKVSPNGPEVSPSGDIPDNQAYVAFAVPGQKLSVKVPEGWSQRSAGGSTTFTDKLNSIDIKVVSAAKAPSPSTVPVPAGGHATTVTRTAGPAVLVKYMTKSAADPVTGKVRPDAVERYVFFKNGKELILTLTAPKGADNVDPWKIVTNSVTWG